MKNRAFIRTIAAFTFVAQSKRTAQPSKDAAAAYPSRPIRLIVPVRRAAASDGMARILGQN